MFAVTLEFLDGRDVEDTAGITYERWQVPCLPAKGDWFRLPDGDIVRVNRQRCEGGRYDDAAFTMGDDGHCTVTLFVIMEWT